MSNEISDDFYTQIMTYIEAGDVDQAVELILSLGEMQLRQILSRLVHNLELEFNSARVRAFESANTLVGANSSIRASAAIFALGLVRANTSASALHRVFEGDANDAKFDMPSALKFEREIELELGKLSRTLKLEIELESELTKLIKMNTLIQRVLESLAP